MPSALNLTVRYLLPLLILAASCKDPREVTVPGEILSKDTMVMILTDIHVVEGARVGNRMMGDTLPPDLYYEKVYRKYHTTKAEFDTSFNFYSRHPALMNEVYDEVVENLNKVEVVPPRETDIRQKKGEEADTVKVSEEDSLRILGSRKNGLFGKPEKTDSAK